jgi:hypothetical protein
MIVNLEHENETVQHTFGCGEQRTKSDGKHHHEEKDAPYPWEGHKRQRFRVNFYNIPKLTLIICIELFFVLKILLTNK